MKNIVFALTLSLAFFIGCGGGEEEKGENSGGGALVLGVEKIASVKTDSEVDFSIMVEAGKEYAITWKDFGSYGSSYDAIVEVSAMGATSDTVFFFDEAGTGSGFVATVAEKVVVSVYGNVGGSFAITARENAPVSLTLGQLTNGTLLQGTGLACWFQFPVSSGKSYYIEVLDNSYSSTYTGSTKYSAYMGSKTGSAFFSDVWTGAKTIDASQAGTVFLKVVPYLDGGSGDTFAVRVSEAAETVLTIDAPYYGGTIDSSEEHWYAFTPASGTLFAVDWMEYGDSGYDASIKGTVYAADKTTVVAAETSFGPVNLTLSPGSKYYLKIVASSAGDYAVQVRSR